MTNYDKKWLVMIYLSGDNDLSEECVWSLTEILRAGKSDDVAVVVQFDPRVGNIRRFDVNRLLKDTPAQKSVDLRTRELVTRGFDLENDDMANVATLKNFIVDSKASNNARHNMLILSGHSGGPTGTGFLIDFFPQHGLSLDEVREAIEGAGGVDILGIDSCGMAMAEVGVQFSDCADFLVASEGFELNTGWPYFSILSALRNGTEVDPRTLASRIVEIHTDYYGSYEIAGVSTDMSACDLKKAPALVEKVKRLAFELTRSLLLQQHFSHRNDSVRDKRIFVEDLPLESRAVADAIVLAHWRAQSYRFERHTDLVDFCELLRDGTRDEGVRKACSDVISIINGEKPGDGYVFKTCHSGGAFQYSNGVAVFFPWAAIDEAYGKLTFPNETGWELFLRSYLRVTRRRAREDSRTVELVARPADEIAIREFPGLGTKDFPEFDEKDFPELGTKDFPELSTKDFPELGTKDFPELGTKDFPELGTKGKLLVPVMKNSPKVFFKDEC
ncbi:MAG TPA: clostripain-related cysteine peptidase [Blastocatellia bacterium]|nr:clostripain-related cysteine peptidase [Blastocatellia bacterium]